MKKSEEFIQLKQSLAYKLSDTLVVRLAQTDKGRTKVQGQLVWSTPWGSYLDLIKEAVLKVGLNGEPHVLLHLLGDLKVYACANSNAETGEIAVMVLFLNDSDLIDTPRAKLPEIPGGKFVQDMKPRIALGLIKERDGGAWKTIKTDP